MAEVTYITVAEDGYARITKSISEGNNTLTVAAIMSQVAGMYMKHIIDINCKEDMCEEILRTNSLNRLVSFLSKNVTDFKFDINVAIELNDYYFDKRNTSNNEINLSEEEVHNALDILTEFRKSIMYYINMREMNEHIESNQEDIIRKLREESKKYRE